MSEACVSFRPWQSSHWWYPARKHTIRCVKISSVLIRCWISVLTKFAHFAVFDTEYGQHENCCPLDVLAQQVFNDVPTFALKAASALGKWVQGRVPDKTGADAFADGQRNPRIRSNSGCRKSLVLHKMEQFGLLQKDYTSKPQLTLMHISCFMWYGICPSKCFPLNSNSTSRTDFCHSLTSTLQKQSIPGSHYPSESGISLALNNLHFSTAKLYCAVNLKTSSEALSSDCGFPIRRSVSAEPLPSSHSIRRTQPIVARQ